MMPSTNFRSRMGLLRSKIMYIWRPFKRKRLRNFYREFIPENSLCFDIGAHLGNRIDAFTALGAKVVAVEPQPLCLDFLNKKFNSNSNVTIIPKAVGANPGTAILHISQLTPTVSTLAEKTWRNKLRDRSDIQVNWEEQQEVQLITLDQLIEKYGIPDFCKIDVEDFEAEVLKGLSHPIPVLSFEFFTWTPQRTNECLEILAQLGDYQYNWSVGESHQMNFANWLELKDLVRNLAGLKEEWSGDIYAKLKK